MRTTKTCLGIVCCLSLFGATRASFSEERVHNNHGVEFETGWSALGYADVRIPGDTGSDISLTEDLSAEARPYVRGRMRVALTDRQTLLILVAPLTLHSTGTINRPVDFEGESFDAGVPLDSTFTFNSYRASWRYTFLQTPSLALSAGVTGKIRQAAIGLRGGGKAATKTNLGFVPLISFQATWWFAESMGLLLDGDALAAPQGRAEDVLVALQVRVADPLVVYGGYRLLEGGADVDTAYTFSLIHYGALGVMAEF
jgi:hypothetical protein